MNKFDQLAIETSVKIWLDDKHGKKIHVGTGFWVAPIYLITCNHVVDGATQVFIGRDIENLQIVTVCKSAPEYDLVLLQSAVSSNKWVSLVDVAPSVGEKLYAFGFSNEFPLGDPLYAQFEGYAEDTKQKWIKLTKGRVTKGFSGSALFNQKDASVIGVISESLGLTSELGGTAVPVSTILSCFLELAMKNETSTHMKEKIYRLIEANKLDQAFDVLISETRGTEMYNKFLLPLLTDYQEYKDDKLAGKNVSGKLAEFTQRLAQILDRL